MRNIILATLLISSATDVMACGLRAPSSADNLRSLAELVETPSSKVLPKMIISGSDSLVVTNEKGEEVKIDDKLQVSEGMTISSKSSKAQIVLPSTGQVIEMLPQTTVRVVGLNKSEDQKICNVSFEMQAGRVTFSSNHLERESDCKPSQAGVFEVVTSNVGITPVGTKYNVDLNQAIAELNGENDSNGEEISVDKGAVQVRIIKLKKSKKKTSASAKVESLNTADYVFDDQKPITIRAGKKAKVKKGKKDRLADIQIVYPD